MSLVVRCRLVSVPHSLKHLGIAVEGGGTEVLSHRARLSEY